MKPKKYRPWHIIAAYIQLTDEVSASQPITKKMLAAKVGLNPVQLSYSVRPDLANVADRLIDCDRPIVPRSA